jgi:hypothetical protein
MKTIKIITLVAVLFFASNTMNAQVNVNVNIGTAPAWAPAASPSVEYYYIPDIQCYYDVRATQFIYLNNGAWIRSRNLPNQYRNYDLNRGYTVVLNDYHGARPYANYKYDKVKYHKGYRGNSQKAVGHKNDNHGNHVVVSNRNDNHEKSNKKGNNGNNGKGNKHDH